MNARAALICADGAGQFFVGSEEDEREKENSEDMVRRTRERLYPCTVWSRRLELRRIVTLM